MAQHIGQYPAAGTPDRVGMATPEYNPDGRSAPPPTRGPMTTTEAAALPVDGRASVVRIVLLGRDECPRRPRRARERAPRRRQPRPRRRLGVGGDAAGFKIARQST